MYGRLLAACSLLLAVGLAAPTQRVHAVLDDSANPVSYTHLTLPTNREV